MNALDGVQIGRGFPLDEFAEEVELAARRVVSEENGEKVDFGGRTSGGLVGDAEAELRPDEPELRRKRNALRFARRKFDGLPPIFQRVFKRSVRGARGGKFERDRLRRGGQLDGERTVGVRSGKGRKREIRRNEVNRTPAGRLPTSAEPESDRQTAFPQTGEPSERNPNGRRTGRAVETSVQRDFLSGGPGVDRVETAPNERIVVA